MWIINLKMRGTKQIVIARAGVTDRGGVTNKGGGTLGSSKQQRIRTTIDNIVPQS